MSIGKVSIRNGFDSFDEQFEPRIGAELNDHAVKLVKVEGEFPWHHHDGIDELYYVFTGQIRIDIQEQQTVELEAGELVVIPAGVEHRPVAEQEAEILLIEPTETRNTGNIENEQTAETRHL